MSWAPRRVPPVRRWPGLAVLVAAAALLAALGLPSVGAADPGNGAAVSRSSVVRLPTVPDDPVPTDPGTIVGVKASRDVQDVARLLRVAGLRVQVLPRIDALFLPRAGADAVRRILSGDGRVGWVEPTRERKLLAEPASALDVSTGRSFDWAYNAVGAGAAIAAVGGGSPDAVAVVDSGVDATHPDLAGRIAAGRDVAFGDATPTDLVGHGTFVAGLISAVDGNGIGTRGVAGATPVVPIRVTTTGSITSANAAAGIVAAVDAGASVVNLSFGGPSLSTAERVALDYAEAHDVLVVAAAGNTRSSGNAALYPAASIGGTRGGWSEGISVGAVDPTGAPAPFSTSNDAVTVSAPGAGSSDDCGDGVYSTIPRSATLWTQEGCLRTTTAPDGTRYGYAEGTSFAAPIVAGGAALVRAANPRLTAAQTADVLRRTARQTLGGGWNPRTGAGVVDLAAAVAAARRYDVTAPVPAIVATPSSVGVSVAVTVRDATSSYASDHASVATVHVEGSSDGVTYVPIAADSTGAVRVTDRAAAGARRWYRATACDANRNCGSAAAGPVRSGASSSSGSGSGSGGSGSVASYRPSLASVSALRPRSCGTCVRIAFIARGRGPLRWSAGLAGAGITQHRSGTLRSSGRRTVAVRLPRLPICGRRMALVLGLSSSLGQTKVTRAVRILGGRCSRSHGRGHAYGRNRGHHRE